MGIEYIEIFFMADDFYEQFDFNIELTRTKKVSTALLLMEKNIK